MKRISALLLALALTLGSVTSAQANGVEVKVKGQWDFAFGWVDNRNFSESANWSSGKNNRGVRNNDGKYSRNDDFEARQRVRTQVNFIASEFLQGVLMFEIGDIDWGRGGSNGRGSGGRIDADGVNVETKRAYLDWIIPSTDISVRMGIQGISLPSTRLGNNILAADVAGITVNSPITDWLDLTVFWARPFDEYRNDENRSLSDTVDVIGVVAPLRFDLFNFSIEFSPYFMYGFIGGNSEYYNYVWNDYAGISDNRDHAKAWWVGGNVGFDIMENLFFSADFAYGRLQRSDVNVGQQHIGFAEESLGAAGWFAAATLDYKTEWGTPGVFGWYGSGDSANSDHDGRLGRMPMVGNDGGNFNATSFGTDGYYGIGNGGNSNAITGTGFGSWGIGVQVADVTFIEDLSHTLRVAYYRGTNDEDLVKKRSFIDYTSDSMYLTKDDYVIEVNFDHKYQIYENLTAVLELGWLHLKTDEDTWGNFGRTKDKDDAWKAELNFRYAF